MAELASTLASTEEDRLTQAEALVRAYCGWHIAPSKEATDTLTLSGGVLLLPSLYVTAVSEVTEDGEALDPDLYSWTRDGRVYARRGWWATWWPTRTRSLTVTYTHGYESPPPDVVAVVRAVAQRAVDNPNSLVRRQVGPFSATYSQTGFNQSLPLALLDGERVVLDHYRIPPRP